MSHINFVIPLHAEELLKGTFGQYSIHEVLHRQEISEHLKSASAAFGEDGPSAVLDTFPVYFSVIQLQKQLPNSTARKALDELEKALKTLPRHIAFALEESESLSDEQRAKMCNVIKMLTYLYAKLVHAMEATKMNTSDDELVPETKKGRKQNLAANASMKVKRVDVVSIFKLLLHSQLNQFWDAPGADALYTNLITDVCYLFLETPDIKQDRDTLSEMWDIFGVLVSEYNANELLIMRLARMVREHDHLGLVLSDGIRHIISRFNCQSILKDIVRELTEWQISATNVDSNGSRFCSKMLVDMAVKMPTEMHSELIYLSNYLNSDSIQLRCMVLAVQVEVVLAHNTNAERTEEQSAFITDVMHRLELYTADKAPNVRAKVFAHITRLQKENAIPVTLSKYFLKRAVEFLSDPTASVRKAAGSCCTTMLRYNSFGPILSRTKTDEELRKERADLVSLQCEIYGLNIDQIKDNEVEWEKHVSGLTDVVARKLNTIPEIDENDAETADEENAADNEQSSKEEEQQRTVNAMSTEAVAAMRAAIRGGEYETAFRHCFTSLRLSEDFITMRKRMDVMQESDFFVFFMHTIFSDVMGLQRASSNVQPSAESMERITGLETKVAYLQNLSEFLALMRRAQHIMIGELLNSVTIGDMQEAVEFITTANQFQLDDAITGILGILKVMRRNEQDRRKIALDSLKSVYLTTDGQNLREHTTEVIERLIKLLSCVTYEQVDAFRTLIAEWADQGMLGNDMFDTMWKYFLRTSTEDKNKSRAALCLLRMAGHGRYSIVEKNYGVVMHVCFGTRVQPVSMGGEGDLLLAIEGIRFLSLLRIRIANDNAFWTSLVDVMHAYLNKPLPQVNLLVIESARCVYLIGQKPIKLIERLFEVFTNCLTTYKAVRLPMFLIVRWNLLLGETALSFLHYLDVEVYKELKRRQSNKGEKENTLEMSKTASKQNRSHRKSASTTNASQLNASQCSVASSASQRRNRKTKPNVDDVSLVGADAEDEEADYISHLLEHCSIAPSTQFGKHFAGVILIVKQPNLYPNSEVQHSAVTALLRGMLLSNEFCEQNIKLIFIVLSRTTFIENKISILLHMSDLLEKAPNIVEPYTSKLYALLEDREVQVRVMALKILAQLTLKDMIRPQEHLWKFAACIVDECEAIRDVAKSFFTNTAQKSNNLYNYLPDIFTHLCNAISEEGQLRETLSYLFAQIENNKQIESLVERFCLKFDNITENAMAINVAFSLTCMSYNDRALRKLVEQFPRYKQFVLVDEVYAHLKGIVTTTLKNATNKKDLEPLAKQMEDLMNEVFAMDGNKAPSTFKKPLAPAKRTASKSARGRAKAVRRSRRRRSKDDDSSSSDEEDNARGNAPTARKRGKSLRF